MKLLHRLSRFYCIIHNYYRNL